MAILGGLKLAMGPEWWQFVARPLGGERGKRVLVAMWASRMFKAVICIAMRSEQSYREKSISFMLFIWIALWHAEVRRMIGWSAGGRVKFDVGHRGGGSVAAVQFRV